MHKARQDSPKAQTDDELGTVTDTSDDPEIGPFQDEHLKYELTFVDETPTGILSPHFKLGPTPASPRLPNTPQQSIRSPRGLCRHNAVIFDWADRCTQSPDKLLPEIKSNASEGESGSERKVHTRSEHREKAETDEKDEQSSVKHHELQEGAEEMVEHPRKRRKLNWAVEKVGTHATRSSSDCKRKKTQKLSITPPNIHVTRRLRPRQSKRI